jgi:hypothetical protein
VYTSSTFTPAGYFAFIAALLWIVVVSVLFYLRPAVDSFPVTSE